MMRISADHYQFAVISKQSIRKPNTDPLILKPFNQATLAEEKLARYLKEKRVVCFRNEKEILVEKSFYNQFIASESIELLDKSINSLVSGIQSCFTSTISLERFQVESFDAEEIKAILQNKSEPKKQKALMNPMHSKPLRSLFLRFLGIFRLEDYQLKLSRIKEKIAAQICETLREESERSKVAHKTRLQKKEFEHTYLLQRQRRQKEEKSKAINETLRIHSERVVSEYQA